MKKQRSDELKRLIRQELDQHPSTRMIARALVFALVLLCAWSATLILYSSTDRITAVVGEPSPRNIKAPRQVTYVSEVKTEESRAFAAAQIRDVYSGPELEMASQQTQRLREIIDYIGIIRQDRFMTESEKVALLLEVPGLTASPDSWQRIVRMDDLEWEGVVLEAQRVLDLIMHEEIRSAQLGDARRQVRRMIALALSDAQKSAIVDLTQDLVVPNTFYDASTTLANREAARNSVEPVQWTIREGESLLREGEIVTDLALEKLRVLNLLDTGRRWQEVFSAILFSLVTIVALGYYIVRCEPLLLNRPRRELLLLLLLIAAGIGARIMIPGHVLLPYLFPAAAFAMLATLLLSVHLGIVVSAIIALLVGLNSGGSVELITLALLGSMIGSLLVWRMDHLGLFVEATGGIALLNILVTLAFRLPNQSIDTLGLFQVTGMGLANAILSSSLTFVAFSFAGRLFGITTSLQLLELARPTHPLLRQLLIKAPGTYHHSLVVSNMAERAAEAIGADGLLARVGCYYHDIGKIVRPYFFAENQSDGENPHDRLDAKTSAEIIIAHTLDGIELARKYGLPDKIRDFIAEHHGTTLQTYFYRQANQTSDANEIREEDFSYPGPRPQSRETAIVMLADSIEASVRARRPATQAETERVIRQIINDRLLSGQLDDSELTLRDLESIREAFIMVLQGIFHPRIQYPEQHRRKAAAPVSPHVPIQAEVRHGQNT